MRIILSQHSSCYTIVNVKDSPLLLMDETICEFKIKSVYFYIEEEDGFSSLATVSDEMGEPYLPYKSILITAEEFYTKLASYILIHGYNYMEHNSNSIWSIPFILEVIKNVYHDTAR